MTDDELRAVFEELNRLGADLSQPPGLALGTGFGDAATFVAWLRTLPDDVGHAEFATRFKAYVMEAEPNAGARLPRKADGGPHRFWPTVEQMHAAIDVLVREWDPLSSRLGELTREDLAYHAYNALGAVLRGDDPERIERLVASKLAEVEREVFGVRPSPREQRRYLARRLIRVVVDHPGEEQDEDPREVFRRAVNASMEIARSEGRLQETRTATGGGVTVCFGPHRDAPPSFDPVAACSECAAIGTVAVVGREIEPRYSRYCPSCWEKVRRRYWDRSPFAGYRTAESASTPEEIIGALDRAGDTLLFEARERIRLVGSSLWTDQAPLIEMQFAPNADEPALDREQRLKQLARGLVARTPTMFGPIPPTIEAFIREHTPADPADA
jgi:hypothetical protein